MWGFHRLKGTRENVWFHPHFIRGSVDGLEHILRTETSGTSKRGPPFEERLTTLDPLELKQVAVARRVIQRVDTSDTSKRGSPPDRRPTFDSSELKEAPAARRVTLPILAQVLGQALDQQLPSNASTPVETTMPDSEVMLVETLQKYHHVSTHEIERIRDEIRLIEGACVARSFSAEMNYQDCRTALAAGGTDAVILTSARARDMNLERQQKEKVTVIKHTLPTSDCPSPVTFVDSRQSGRTPMDATMPVEATVLDPDAMLADTMQKYHQITQLIARNRCEILRLLDEKKQRVADQPVSPALFPLGSIITVEQLLLWAVPMLPFSRPPEHEIRELVAQQQQAKATLFQVTLPTSVYPLPVTFVNDAPVRENLPYYPSFSYPPLSLPR